MMGQFACSKRIEFSQDQWDIYRLDPEYDCFVQAPPLLSIISWVGSSVSNFEPQTIPRSPSLKRHIPSAFPEDEISLPLPPAKRTMRRTTPDLTSNSNSADEELEMIVDDEPPCVQRSSRLSKRAKNYREYMEKNRKIRREKIARAKAKLSETSNEGNKMFVFPIDPIPRTTQSQSSSPENTIKRKGMIHLFIY